MSNIRNNKRNFFGAVLLGLGSLLLLHNLHLIPWIPSFLFTWKIVPLLVGIYLISVGRNFNGFALLGIGIYFIVPELLNISIQNLNLVWPAILIFLGIKFLFDTKHKKLSREFLKSSTETGETIDISIFMSGETRSISSYNFKGGHISSVMGGAELDLTNCTLADGGALLDISVVMGGVELTIPREWNVRSEVTPILGGIEDHAFQNADIYIDPAAQLILTGKVIMGGIEIKRI